MVEIQSLDDLRKIQQGGVDDQSTKTGKALAATLKGLEMVENTQQLTDLDPTLIEEHFGTKKTVDFLYLLGVYGINEAAMIDPSAEEGDKVSRSSILHQEVKTNAPFWEGLRKHFTALGYTEEDKDVWLRLVTIYVGSSENRKRLKLMTPPQLDSEILKIQTPLGYRTKMEGIYQRSFGAFSRVGSNNKDETGHILGVEYPEEFSGILARCSDEIGEVVAAYNSEHMEDDGYIPVRYVPYTSEKMHTTIAVVRKPSSDTERTRKNEEQGIALDEADTILEKAPTFEVQGIGSSADTVVVKTLPKDGRQLGLVQKTVLEGKTDSSETIGSGPLSHITVGRFVTDDADNRDNIGKPAVRVISGDLVARVQEVMNKYTQILQQDYPVVSPTAVFSGNFDLNTVGTATPQFALNKNKVVSFKNIPGKVTA